MSDGTQVLETGLDLNKPLPPSPRISTDSPQSSSSRSEYSTATGIGMELTLNHESYVVNSAMYSTGVSASENPSSTSDSKQHHTNPIALIAKNRTFRWPKGVSRSKTGKADGNNDFKTIPYSNVAERPRIFHPQSRLVDITKTKKRKRLKLGSLLKGAKAGSENEKVPSRSNSATTLPPPPPCPPPPRPPRPPSHLCPSPPYNPANMPSWRRSDPDLDQIILPQMESEALESNFSHVADRESNMSSQSVDIIMLQPPNSPIYNFVNSSDLKVARRHSEVALPSMSGHKNKVDGSTTPNSFSAVVDAYKSTQQSVERLVSGCKVQNPKFEQQAPTNGPRRKGTPISGVHKHGPTGLVRLPEDASVRSFSRSSSRNHAPEQINHNELLGDRPSPRLGSPYSPQTSRIHSASRESRISAYSGILDDAPNSDAGEQAKYGRERARAVSDRLREHYRQEWDELFSKTPEHVEEADRSHRAKHTRRGKRLGQIMLQASHDTSKDRHTKISSINSQSRHLDPDELDDVSRTEARLAQLCNIAGEDQEYTDATIKKNNTPDYVRHITYGAEIGELLPAPLRIRHSQPYTPATNNFSHLSKFHSSNSHATDSTISISPYSPQFRERIFTDSSVANPFVDSPVTEPSDWENEYQSRSPSPVLSTPPDLPEPRFEVHASPPQVDQQKHVSTKWDLRQVREALRLSRASLDTYPDEESEPALRRIESSVSLPDQEQQSEHHGLDNTNQDQDPTMFDLSRKSTPTRPPRPPRPDAHLIPTLPPFSFQQPPSTITTTTSTTIQPSTNFTPPIPRRSSQRPRNPSASLASPPPRRSTSQPPTAYRRPSTKPTPPIASGAKADLIGECPQSQSRPQSRRASTSKSRSDSGGESGGSSARSSQEGVRDYGPFREMQYRGRSVLYHVNAQGEFTF